jgi:hypothetical protein
MMPKPVYFTHSGPRPATQPFEETDPTYGPRLSSRLTGRCDEDGQSGAVHHLDGTSTNQKL